jgi:demethylmenaquinone methyltransferase / 2-methoxy-6-polyprenyl-1,4-benzoquinol methylase
LLLWKTRRVNGKAAVSGDYAIAMAEGSPVWSDDNLANPHAAADKAQRVRSMFAAIAPRYDLNNRLHSLWRDQAWRRAAVHMAELKRNDIVLDVACGTGDLALAFAGAGAERVWGIDFTFEMLTIAGQKGHARSRGLDSITNWAAGDALRLPLPDACVDVVSIAFGIRNVSDPAAAVREFVRVLRPGGRLVILEFSLPRNRLLRAGYNFYFQHILPRSASLIAHDRSGAYRYLPQSVQTFIDGPAMLATMAQAGLSSLQRRKLTFGIAAIYRGLKPR